MRPVPARPPSWGSPGFLGPGPGGLENPYTLDEHEDVGDPGAWQLWWEFNKDAYLRYGRIRTGATATAGDDFFLGAGEHLQRVGGRADRALVETRITPSLLDAISKGGSNEFMQEALLGIAKIGGDKNRAKFDYILNWYLDQENSNEAMSRVAPVALGILSTPASYPALANLALDNERGREIYGGEVDETMRAFAAYGMGLIGSRSTDGALRTRVVRDLVAVLEDEETDTNEPRVAAMFSLGLVPLDVVEDIPVCYCGTCKVEGPETSLQAQTTYLLRYFTADKEFDSVVRAHTATTLGRLIEARPSGMTLRLKEVVAEFLIEGLARYAKQPPVVKQSIVASLGLIGDADGDEVDQWIRWALGRSATRGGPIEQRFALMSLAQVGARAGQVEESRWAGTNDARTRLLHALSRGKKDVKPWAGLALGVMGYHLTASGQESDDGVDLALRRAIRQSKTADSLGAYALAAGLRADDGASEELLKKLDKVKDEAAASYASLGLGLMGSDESVAPLRALLEEADEKPLLALRAGVALGLLGDAEIVGDLCVLLEETESLETRVAAARTLGYLGDRRGVEKLLELIGDENAAEEVKEAAVAAIGFASDPAPRSWRSDLTRGTNYLARTTTLTNAESPGVLDMR